MLHLSNIKEAYNYGFKKFARKVPTAYYIPGR